MKPDGTLHFGSDYIAEGLEIDERDVRLIFQDGRNIGSILEYRFAALFGHHRVGGDRDRDLDSPGGRRFEVRSITARGATLLPPSMYGKGRSIDMPTFLERLQSLSGYVFADALAFPEVPYWSVPILTVQGWVEANQLGKSLKASHSKFIALLKNSFYMPLSLDVKTVVVPQSL